MSEAVVTPKATWTSRSTFLMAAIGCAVGLGNLWRFPYIAGQNGGSAFIMVYIGFVFILGVPLIMSELAIGREGKMSAVETMNRLIARGYHPIWKIIGWISILVPILGLSYYCVIAGWSVEYIFKAAMGEFTGVDAAGSGAIFQASQDNVFVLIGWFSIFLFTTVFIISKGVKNGLEKAVKVMLPALFIILVFLAIYAMSTGDSAKAIDFLINPDFTKLTPRAILEALGQALFSLAIGVGGLITYGAYLPDDVSLPKSAGLIAIADTMVALLAGFAIFPIVFEYGLEPSEGPGLIFATLPIAFGQMPGGILFGTLFFILLSFAALSSTVGMLEPIVSWFVDKGKSRVKMAWGAGVIAWSIGMFMVLSFNVLVDYKPLDFIPLYEGKNLFGIMDYTVANVLIPINALFLGLFAGWAMTNEMAKKQFGFPHGSKEFTLWRISTKYIATFSITLVVYMMIFGNPF
ncbi:MAG: sodium-dependent transporter [Kordiimonadaceae bacterium]|jgi:neurotransmitter:Na+ symporter, NSS family|nr:sodium-dependent transporter [Kordiimonadaceae bacterium]MBT6036898.1 sodium-dependent transporter [Kordiimonadaceae bacterium]MBT6328506.1 sodium-dependent transporter [Kordiimonadaceae bacterium]MBT7581700.1 sodium-dependent transporter [Kordiimonadaceae bacterium]